MKHRGMKHIGMRIVARAGWLSIALLAACSKPTADTVPATTRSAQNEPAYTVTPWPLDPGIGAAQPDLIAAAHGLVLLTWISSEPGRRPALLFSSYDGTRWRQQSRTVAVGTALLADWADTPHLATTPDGAYWIQWLQKNPAATEASDILLSRSRSNGKSWSPPIPVNDDGTATEHGFVSLWAQSESVLGAAWLDGRKKIAADATHGGHAGHEGAMTLRAAWFDGDFKRSHETELDAVACDCCQTDVAATAKGLLLAYRDRTAQEIRDIQTTRFDGERWTAPSRVHADDWTMAGCPVNGPAIAARGNDAVVAWYTQAAGEPKIKIARSTDAGDHFDVPVIVDRGEAVQGRVDAAYDGTQAWIVWIREDAGGQSLQLTRYSADLSRELQRIEIAGLQGRGRGTGFPKLVLSNGTGYLVWTDLVGGQTRLRGATVQAR